MEKILMKKLALIALATSLLASTQAVAQDAAKILGTFKEWEVHSFQESGAKVCNMFTMPTESDGKYTQRGKVYIFVTNRPSDGVSDEFS
ncbi:MAG: invasion associated locus B family protein, partial [Alphaproteobacteria bacterium]